MKNEVSILNKYAGLCITYHYYINRNKQKTLRSRNKLRLMTIDNH